MPGVTTLDPSPRPSAAPDLDELFRRHADRMWSVAVRLLGDPAEAEDAVQEAFLSALRSSGFRGEAAAGTWLHRILVNGCLDRLRARSRGPARARTGAMAGSGPDPAGSLADRLVVEAALARLPAEQRAAVVLVDVLSFPVTEAAEILGIPTGTVKSRCARGRARLAALLGRPREAP